MPTPEFPVAIWYLLGAVLGVQVISLLVQLRQGARLRRLENRTAATAPTAGEPSDHPKTDELRGQRKLFRQFLEEDPARQELPKREQFEQFRQWRAEKGLNWKSPAS